METISNIMGSDRDYDLDYGLDEDKGQTSPSPSDDSRHIMNALTQQIQGLSLDSFHLTQGPGPKTVTITNRTPRSSGDCDL